MLPQLKELRKGLSKYDTENLLVRTSEQVCLGLSSSGMLCSVDV